MEDLIVENQMINNPSVEYLMSEGPMIKDLPAVDSSITYPTAERLKVDPMSDISKKYRTIKENSVVICGRFIA